MANDFSGDTNCVALWRFESGALTADSKGTNTLTDVGTVQESTGAGGYKEGSCAADLEANNNEWFSIADASLDAGFPLKNGDSNKKISLTFWFRIESFTNSAGLYSKADDNKRSLLVYLISTGTLAAYFGYNSGVDHEQKNLFTSLVTGRWYHLGFTYQDSDKSYFARLWDDTAGALHAANATGNATNNINVEDSVLYIGSYKAGSTADFDGQIDELAVFKDILSEAEIDSIRAGTYGAAGGGMPIAVAMYHYMHH